MTEQAALANQMRTLEQSLGNRIEKKLEETSRQLMSKIEIFDPTSDVARRHSSFLQARKALAGTSSERIDGRT